MKIAPLPSMAFLKECVEYNPNTGILFWKRRPLAHFQNAHRMKIFNTQFSGEKAGCLRGNGYIYIHFSGIGAILAHRAIFKLMTGRDPVHDVDHKNLDRADNRWENLREATRAQNMHNTIEHRDSFHQLKGVDFSKQKNKFRARICMNGKAKNLGLFSSGEDAHRAYCNAASELHGEFFNQGVIK